MTSVSDDDVAAAASAGKPVIVVANSVGPLILESILSHENIVAVVWAGIAGLLSRGLTNPMKVEG